MGSITESIQAELTIQNHTTLETFLITELGDDDAMIGIEWIKEHNPEIDWRSGKLQFTRCPSSCQTKKPKPNTSNTLITSTEDDETEPPEPHFSLHTEIELTPDNDFTPY
jgi:hypothetical protein